MNIQQDAIVRPKKCPGLAPGNLTLVATLGPLILMLATSGPSNAADPVSFRADVAPILRDKCLACHGPKKAEGGFRVDAFVHLMREGDSGLAGFTPRELDDSEVYRRIASEDASERMPLDADPLPADSIALFRRWIEQGASFDGDNPADKLVTIIPPPTHPKAPESYPFPVPVIAVEFSPDGRELFAGGYHEVTVWDGETGDLLRRITNVGERVYAISRSPDGQLLAVGCGAPGRHGETRLFRLQTGQLAEVLGTTSDVVLDVAFNAAGDRLATAGADGTIRLFDVASSDEQLLITSHSDWVSAVAWSQDGSRLASASRDKTAKVFDSNTGELLVTYSGHGEPVQGVAFHPGGKEVYSSGGDNRIHVWKMEGAEKTKQFEFEGIVFKLPIGDDFLFAASADKTVRQFEPGTQKQLRSFSGHQDWALSVAFNAETRRVASGGFDGRIQIWDSTDGRAVSSFWAAPGFESD